MTRDEYIAARRAGKTQEEIVGKAGGSLARGDYSALFSKDTGLSRDEYIAARRSGKSQEEIVAPYQQARKTSSAAEMAMETLMAGGSRAANPYDGMSGEEIHAVRKQEEETAKGDFWKRFWDYVGSGLANAAIGQNGSWGRSEEQSELARRQIDDAAAMKDAKARQKEASKAIEWDGRQELIDEYKKLRRQALFDPQGVDSARMQEVHEQLAKGDADAGNGNRSYGALDRAGNILTGAAENIGSEAANLWSNVNQIYEQEELRRQQAPTQQLLEHRILGTDGPNDTAAHLQRYIESDERKAKYAKIDAAADKLSDAAAEDLQTAKEGLGIMGQAGVDIAENVLEMGFDAGVGYLTGGGSLGSMFARVYGQSVGEARRTGADVEQQALYGLAKGAIEVATEKMFDFGGIYGGGWLDDVTSDVVRQLTGNKAGRALLLTLGSASQEGLEEVVSDLLAPFAERIYNDDALQNGYFSKLDLKDMRYSYLIGMAIGSCGAVTKAANGGFSETLDQMDMRDAGIGSMNNQTGAAMDVLTGRMSADEQQVPAPTRDED